MNILQIISLVQALKALLDDPETQAVITAALPEIKALISALASVLEKIDLSKLEPNTEAIITKIEDLIKK